ncbi:hypothetical protein PINS_up004978 [Pythium insidiosum]|nr:hypothetical protein PINS_up004978 [Pythium insidiosum]
MATPPSVEPVVGMDALEDEENRAERLEMDEEEGVATQALPLEEADDESDSDSTLDVVVTGVELEHTSSALGVVGSAAYLLGLYPFVVELVVTRASGTEGLRRSLSTLLSALQTALPTAKAPEFPAKQQRNDAALAEWCADMTAFLAAHREELQTSSPWLSMLRDDSCESDAKCAQMSAIEFILQPFPFDKFYVPRGSRHEVVVPVKRSDHYIVWRFDVEDHDIDFSVSFLATPSQRFADADDEVALEVVHATTRYVATEPGSRLVEGSHQCSSAGTATFVWDNSYSRLRGKNIQYQVQVVHRSIMESAIAAADAFDEALQAKRKREELLRAARASKTTSGATTTADTQIVQSPRSVDNSTVPGSTSFLIDTSASLYRQIFADKLSSQNWLVSTPMNVAGKLVSRLFGSPLPGVDGADSSTGSAQRRNDAREVDSEDEFIQDPSASEAKSLLEELNGLNMQLLERLERCEDTIAKLTVERDQERSRVHLAAVEKENLHATVASKDLDVQALRSELQRFDREREAWREIQQERDALLEEKHRWAMTDDFVGEEESDDGAASSGRLDLDGETKNRLEHELGQAEAQVLRLRAELGYSLSNHLTGTSTRLEKIAREMTASKKQYEDQIQASEAEVTQLKQLVVKYRSQKRVLVAELKNIQAQADSQVAVAMAEANEARMVNKRLKKQNELLLTQIRSLVDDAREQERKLQDQVEIKIREARLALERLPGDERTGRSSANGESPQRSEVGTSPVMSPRLTARIRDQEEEESIEREEEQTTEVDQSPVPYTLTAAQLAMLNGERAPGTNTSVRTEPEMKTVTPAMAATAAVPVSGGYRARLMAFFQEKDPAMLPEVDSMLESYAGVEDMLFESLELKYSFLALSSAEM